MYGSSSSCGASWEVGDLLVFLDGAGWWRGKGAGLGIVVGDGEEVWNGLGISMCRKVFSLAFLDGLARCTVWNPECFRSYGPCSGGIMTVILSPTHPFSPN